MMGSEIHYLFGGLTVLVTAIGFLKMFDFLANQSVKRLLDAAARYRENE